MNDGTMPTQDPVVMPDNSAAPVDDGMGAPAPVSDAPAVDAPAVPASDGGMGDDAPVAEPAAPVDGGMGAPEMPAPAMPAEGEAEAPADDVPAPM